VLKDKTKVLLATGDNQGALACYLKAFGIAPEDPVIIAALAKTYKLMNMQPESLIYYKKLLELNCDSNVNDDARRLKDAINTNR
jgi:tetratricopeptide (TPR) repeat protein